MKTTIAAHAVLVAAGLLRCSPAVVVVASSVVIAPAVAVISGTSVAVAANQCNGPTDDFDGEIDDSDGGYGATGYVSVRDAALCSKPLNHEDNHISAWVAISSATRNDGAQAGYRKTIQYPYWLQFAEWFDHNGGYGEKSFGSGLPNGTDTFYEDVYLPGDDEQMLIDDSYGFYTPYDPSGVWPGPWQEFWAGEVWDEADEMPGTLSQQVNFTYLQIQPHQTINMSSPTQVTGITPSYEEQGCHSTLSVVNFSIWHEPCS